MTEEKMDVLEETTVETEQIETDELVEESNEVVEETAVEEQEDVDENETAEVENVAEKSVDEVETSDAPDKKRITKGIKVAIVAGVTTVILLLVLFFNPFNMKWVKDTQRALHIGNAPDYSAAYIDTTGRTVGEVASEMGMAFGEFVVYYDLPDDLTEDIHEHAAISLIPAKTYAEKQLKMSFEEAKELYGWDDTVTKSTPIGEAKNKTTLAKVFGEEQIENIKVLYNLDKDVTGDTLYGEVRNDIELRMKAEREANEVDAANSEEDIDSVAEEALTETQTEEQ